MGILKEFAFFILHYMIVSFCECAELPTHCDPNTLYSCGKTSGIVCIAATQKCECSTGYEYHPESPDICIKKRNIDPSSDSSSHTTSVVMVVFLTLLLLGSALFFIVRRYNLLHWVHNKIFSNRNTGATYEDVMIGHDDPPLSA